MALFSSHIGRRTINGTGIDWILHRRRHSRGGVFLVIRGFSTFFRGIVFRLVLVRPRFGIVSGGTMMRIGWKEAAAGGKMSAACCIMSHAMVMVRGLLGM